MECSVGILTEETCHQETYGKVKKDLISFIDIDEETQQILQLRLNSDNIRTLCEFHKKKYLIKFNHLFGASCSDPLDYHRSLKKKGTKGCVEIKLDHVSKAKVKGITLIPGKSLCPTCYKKLFSLENTVTNDEDKSDDCFIPPQETLQSLDSLCSVLNISPASNITKVSTAKRKTALVSKSERIAKAVKRKLQDSFEEPLEEEIESLNNSDHLCKEYEELILKLKNKCSLTTSNQIKANAISVMPSNWSRAKICEELNVSDYLVRKTKDLMNKQGILPIFPRRKEYHQLSEEEEQLIVNFFELEENSRILPGKKDCVSVIVNGKKVQKQKRLVLCNLKEIYLHFKNTHPNVKVGISKFCSLRPKWCKLAGSAGTHSVCVCIYHQNIKLMLQGANMNVDYKDLLSLVACDVENYDCMLGNCEDCDSVEILKGMLEEELSEVEDEISYKLWTSTDRSNLIEVVQSPEEYIEDLLEKLINLKKHHYIAKEQASYLKEKKENLTESECIVLADFAENYSFVVQDESQGFHWTKAQSTVHPFVIYFKDGDKVKSKSFCVISDYLKHDTVSVHAFQKHLVENIKSTLPNVKKLIYFSDGASSQYKNRKNFANLCNHKKDFGLDAEWHFFATAHGKNACDGVGGTTKRETARASLQRPYKEQIMTTQQFFDFCNENIQGIKYVLVTEEEIKRGEVNLRKRFDNCCKIPKTREIHKLVPLNECTVRCYRTSKTNEFEDTSIALVPKIAISDLQQKDLVVVVYDEEWYPAEIEAVNNEHNDVFVVFFTPPGPRTSFKKSSEKCWVPIGNVLMKLTPLQLSISSGRNTYQISEKLCNEVSAVFNKYRKA